MTSAHSRCDALLTEAKQWESAQRDRKAILCYEEALTLCSPTDPESIEKRIRIYISLAALWCQQGKYSLATKQYETVLKETQAFYQDTPNEHTGLCHYKCAQLYETIWRLDPALNHYQSALAHFAAVWPEDHPLIQKVMDERENTRRKYEKNKAEKAPTETAL